MTSQDTEKNDKILQKIIYFSEAFKDDPLFNFIKNHGLLDELFDYEGEFLKSINTKEKYNTNEAALLVGASSGQRILNIINDRERDFNGYIEPEKVGGKLYIHDATVLFKLRMIFFLLSHNYKVNEVAHILGIVHAIGVVKEEIPISKRDKNHIQQAEMKEMLFEHLKPIYDILNSITHAQDMNSETIKQFMKISSIKDEIKDSDRDIRYLERELERLRTEALSIRFNIKTFERKYLEKPQQKTNFWKSLFSKKDNVHDLSIESSEKDLYGQMLKNLDDNSIQIEKIRESLAAARERNKLQKLRLQEEINERGPGDLNELTMNNHLKEQILNINQIAEEQKTDSMSSIQVEENGTVASKIFDVIEGEE